MTEINTEMGYRLLRLEFLNWGTFSNGKIYSVDTSGKTALITGANGSGKSTLVDALLTLLVPSQKRNYNLASGTERKRDRDEKTYIQGNYGKTTDEALGSKILKMREPGEGHISILLAVFYSEEIKLKNRKKKINNKSKNENTHGKSRTNSSINSGFSKNKLKNLG